MRRIITLATLLSLACAPGALAATRYVSPTGTAAKDCQTAATACDLKTAIAGKPGDMPQFGDEVIVAPGSYSVAAEINPGAGGLQVHGQTGAPRPVITSPVNAEIFNGNGLNLSYLDFEANATDDTSLLVVSNDTLDRLLMRGDPGGNPLCQCYNGTLRDSVLVDTGASGEAWGINSNGGSGNETLRNDTLVTTKGGTPLELDQEQAMPIGPLTVDARNVLALSETGGHDVVAIGAKTTITIANSSFASSSKSGGGAITDAGGNITSAPLLVNVASGDFHQQPASPTIDKGTDDTANDGPLDFDGNPRVAGTHTDIGAFEFQPPAAVTALSGASQSATVGTQFAQPLKAKVSDAQGNPVAGVTVTFTAPTSGPGGSFAASAAVTTAADGTATAPAFTANFVAGSYTVRAATKGVGALFALRNLPGPVTQIKLSPAQATIAAGALQRYAIEGFDAHGNDAGNVTAASTLAIAPDGSCSGATCTASKPGTHTVTAHDGSASATAQLEVSATASAPLTLLSKSVTVALSSRRGTLSVRCDANVCAVTGTLTRHVGKRTVNIGTVSGRVDGGHTGRLLIEVTKAAARALRHGTFVAAATLHVTTGAGTSELHARLHLKKKRHHKR